MPWELSVMCTHNTREIEDGRGPYIFLGKYSKREIVFEISVKRPGWQDVKGHLILGIKKKKEMA